MALEQGNPEGAPRFVRCRIFLAVPPAADREIWRWWESGQHRFTEGECGIRIGGRPELVGLLGPYDFVIELDAAESLDGIGMLVGWIRQEIGKHIESSVTVIERGHHPKHWQARSGRTRVRVLVSVKPLPLEQLAAFERTLREFVKRYVLECVKVFGEYDVLIEFGVDGLGQVVKVVDSLRRELGGWLQRTVTLIEREKSREGEGARL